jgi:hypothetical protein
MKHICRVNSEIWEYTSFIKSPTQVMNYYEIDCKVQDAKKANELKVNQDGFKPTDSLEWWSAISSTRWTQPSGCWIIGCGAF